MRILLLILSFVLSWTAGDRGDAQEEIFRAETVIVAADNEEIPDCCDFNTIRPLNRHQR